MTNYEDSRVANTRNYLIPELNIEANDGNLKNLKKKMLANYYDRQINQKKAVTKNAVNPEQQYHRPDLNYKDINQMYVEYERAVKKELAHQYQQEMQEKMEKRKMQRRKSLEDEYARLNKIHSIEQFQRQKAKQESDRYKREAKEMLERSNSLKQAHKMQLRREREEFNNRYSSEKLKAGKYSYFRDYYSKLNEAQNEIEKNYIEKWQPEIIRRQEKRFATNSPSKYGNPIVQRNLSDHHIFEQHLREEWRQSLEQQIREKEDLRRRERQQRKHKYTEQKYEGRHHPINNPIDFKITHDNKYILRELTQEQPQMSRLAHSGSQALLS